ncbi:MAG: phosphoribosyl-ATP diphosphatase [Firmicutes bacterium]|nr:phosphoribosyl-ATP diphosphatase [Bacillota bacterium]
MSTEARPAERKAPDPGPLYPVVVQDQASGQVVMVAYANPEALALTRETGLAHFYSRSRQRLWKKGETSGHIIPVNEVVADCDGDAFLYRAAVIHPACHRNTYSCFGEGAREPLDPWRRLRQIVRDRLAGEPDASSYTWRLMGEPLGRLVQKVGEEAVEVVISAMATSQGTSPAPELVGELVDLFYHLAVLAERMGVSDTLLATEVARRHNAPREPR